MSFAEILIQGSDELTTQDIQTADKHTFIINKYIPTQPQPPVIVQQQTSIMVEQLVSEVKIKRCEKANFSFKITNPSSKAQIYSFKVKDFSGTGYITPNLQLNSKQSKKVDYTLMPDCSQAGDFNPSIHVETQDESEEAVIPAILHIEDTKYLEENDCEYYYDKSVCDSAFYIRFDEDTTYEMDLSKLFYDPDADKLEYTTSRPTNLQINIKGTKAKIKPLKDWYGTEEITFYAIDGKGGKAESKKFYFHVLDKGEGFSLAEFFSSIFS